MSITELKELRTKRRRQQLEFRSRKDFKSASVIQADIFRINKEIRSILGLVGCPRMVEQ